MILGSFYRNGPRVVLSLRDVHGGVQDVECLVDTGFGGELKRPPYWIGILRAPKVGVDSFELADGTSARFELYHVRVEWEGVVRDIEVVEMVGEPLIGISLLRGYRLDAEMEEGGVVRIVPL